MCAWPLGFHRTDANTSEPVSIIKDLVLLLGGPQPPRSLNRSLRECNQLLRNGSNKVMLSGLELLARVSASTYGRGKFCDKVASQPPSHLFPAKPCTAQFSKSITKQKLCWRYRHLLSAIGKAVGKVPPISEVVSSSLDR